ncbi:diaminopimelate decarboxylase [Kitasatospora griseola]|uniref:diaminopimelate decarboxylase n=1 Tax=Kitasatospora griseola TaxID=2064 RepID=UPI003855AA67
MTTLSDLPELSPVRSAPRPLGSPWPASARPGRDGDLTLGGVSLREAAERFGTPLYVLDEDEVRRRARAYRRALPDADVLYAAKAFLCTAMAEWIAEEGLGLDVCSAGELSLAAAAGFPPERILLHGNAKTPEELRLARRLRVGRIVIDNLAEVPRLAALTAADTPQRVLVRVLPGVAAGHHSAVRTGVDGQKFGFSIAAGEAAEVIRRILAQPGLRLTGLHCHLGSQITDTAPYLTALDRLVDLLALIRDRHGVELPELDLGGGHGVRYLPDDPELAPAHFAAEVTTRLAARCAENGLAVPKLTIEPGRAIAAPAAVAVYRVLSVKHTADGHAFAAVDGGMSDNPRPALYGSAYTVRLLGRTGTAPTRPFDVVGRHCEAGDILARNTPLPTDLRPGDLLTTPTAGAYHLSMSSTYNLTARPPVATVHAGHLRLLIRRETLTDLHTREVTP